MNNLYELFHQNTSQQYKVISTNNFTYRHLIKFSTNYLRKNMKILDIGCGAGTIDFYLAKRGYDVTGVDISRNAINACRQTANNLKITNAHFLVLDFPNKSLIEKYDFTIFSEVIEHLPNDNYAIKMIYKMLKLNGYLVITTPLINAPLCRIGLTKKFDIKVGHLRRYDKDTILKLLKENHLSVLKVEENEGIIRNFLFTNKIAGKSIKLINYLFSDSVTILDDFSRKIFGNSNIYIVAKKIN